MRVMNLLLGLMLSLMTGGQVGLLQAGAQTPESGIVGPDPEVTEVSGARQLRWGQDALPVPESEATGAAWVPMSVRYVEYEDEMYIFVELRNASGSDAAAPILISELSIEGDSYGQEELYPDNGWVPAGASAFYFTSSFYGGSLAVGDWDAEAFTVRPNPYSSVVPFDSSLIRIEGERLFNDGDTPLGEVYFTAIIRDDGGIFTAGCMGPYTGALTPPRRSVKLSSSLDETEVPSCGFSAAGDAGSEALGHGAPYRTEYVISRIES